MGESLSNIILRQETRILDSENKAIGSIHSSGGEDSQLTLPGTAGSTWDNIHLTPPGSHNTSHSTIYRDPCVTDKEVVKPLIGSENQDVASEIQVIDTTEETTESHSESSHTVKRSKNKHNKDTGKKSLKSAIIRGLILAGITSVLFTIYCIVTSQPTTINIIMPSDL